MESIADLFGRQRTALPQGKVLDERKELIKFFCQKLERDGERVGVQLGHYKDISDLYALKSAFNDRLTRDGTVAARKWFWWVTKTKAV